ncbi:MAG: DUF2283 domain-containing protein [Deltaproteobacteria bacterium]|nr:DUF2283 domain-containing protein [Deltaproteobacteria bacterium]
MHGCSPGGILISEGGNVSNAQPYPEQESEELGDEVIARLNPVTGEIESLEILFFSTRLLRSELFEVPVKADLRMAAGEGRGHV